jgi:hypothetical protein
MAEPEVMAERVAAFREAGFRVLQRTDGLRCQWPSRLLYSGCPLEEPGSYVGLRLLYPAAVAADSADLSAIPEVHVWLSDSAAIQHMTVEVLREGNAWKAGEVELLLAAARGG